MNIKRYKIEGSEWIGGTSLTSGRPSATYKRGRVCAASGCGTRLSRYNSTIRCSLHDELH